MFGIIGFIRELFGNCPICGGHLKCIDHNCIEGDSYVCEKCGHKWHS